jgi:hypothetical protein
MKSDSKHTMEYEEYHYNGYGGADLVKEVLRCSCGEWLHSAKDVLEHKVETLWNEREDS